MSKHHKHVNNDQQSTHDDQRAAKKAAVLGANTQKSRLPYILIALCALLLVSGATLYAFKNNTVVPAVVNTPSAATQTASADQPEATTAQTDEVSYPISLFGDGQAKYFEHQDGDLTIKYFVVKSSDGIIRAAFDACDVCWPAGKGYRQEGDFMVCNNCGRRFKTTLVNEVQGGCNPAPLTRMVKDFNVILKVADILKGRMYFDFSNTKRG